MQQVITGKAFVLGDNIDTDQIIPAQYLTYNPAIPAEYKMFGKFALIGVPTAQSGLPKGHVPFHDESDEFISPYKIVIGGKNFGCGSSREHAPIALAAAGIEVVVAEFYARIFYRNSLNLGLPAIEAPEAVAAIAPGDAVAVDLEGGTIEVAGAGGLRGTFPFPPFPPFLLQVIRDGGLIEHIRRQGAP